MREVSTLSLGSSSDLVVKCSWSPGIIPADEPVLPKTRLAITFRTLFALRKRAREALDPAFADPIERLEQIHSFRLAAEEDGLRLSVTYDFGWEVYMRALWAEKAGGPFLDLLCCHCEGYALARHTPLDLWQKWIRKNQIQSDYFYSATGLTVGDLAALGQAERLQRDEVDVAGSDRSLAGFRSASAEKLAKAKRDRNTKEAQDQAIRVIVAMYRLTRYWTADVERSVVPEDAITLIRATRALIEDHFIEDRLSAKYEKAFKSELAWYRQPVGERPPVAKSAEWEPARVQKGVVTSFDKKDAPITHGAAVFLAVTDPQQARKSLAGLAIASEALEPADGVFRNLAFTHAGLRRLEMAPEILQSAPPAFREGAAARAGSVGDVRGFHPINWRPLRRNWGPNPEWEVELDQVDALVQLRVSKLDEPDPLRAEIEALEGGRLPGLEVLAVERLGPAVAPGSDEDRLGFRDGLSQPTLTGEETQPWSDKVEPGALLVGRGEKPADSFWQDGSFIAIRRMTIDRAKFDTLLNRDSRPGIKNRDLIAAKLLGRNPDGTRIGTKDTSNNFDFEGDESGAVCPLDSHIRRANPRVAGTPRIMRRGMSFGPPVTDDDDTPGVERGSFFMAYCADLAEQYERILGWVNGGNSTRIGSYLADPLSGVPEHAARTYRFLHDDEVRRLSLPGPDESPIGLSWSLYLFAPSLPAIQALATSAGTAAPDPEVELAERGRVIIARLQNGGASREVWRSLLNEPGARDQGAAEAIWAAIRTGPGILDTPAGYLVGRYDLVLEVLRDDGRRFSNRGAGERMEKTIGQFHLGLDPNTAEYATLSEPANSALRSVKESPAFGLAYAETKTVIKEILAGINAGESDVTIDLLGTLIEPVLARIATTWFDVPDGTHVESAAHDWTVPNGRKPRYAGDFWNPSKHAFNPFHSRETERRAITEGQAAVAAVTELINSTGRDGLKGSVSKQMATDTGTTSYPTHSDLARALVGCMVGGVPTIAGNAVRLLVEGLEKGELDRAQGPWLMKMKTQARQRFALARALFGPKIEKLLAYAPIPEVLWRVVASDDDRLGQQPLEKGRILIFSLESAGRDQLRQTVDNYIPFGMAPPNTQQTPHGCPGREMANGTILGLLVGLLESARFRPGVRGMAILRPLA